MSRKNIALSKTNLIVCSVAVVLIIVGFLLMTGPATNEVGFETDIFSFRRIKIAPIVVLVGFVLMVVGILYPSKER